jgi:hypothetical protein
VGEKTNAYSIDANGRGHVGDESVYYNGPTMYITGVASWTNFSSRTLGGN